MKKRLITIWLLCLLVLPVNAWAKTITAASCSQRDVQDAIDDAEDGDIVQIPEGQGTWEEPVSIGEIISWAPLIYEGKQITLLGAGMDKTIITDGVLKGPSDDVPLIIISVEGKSVRVSGITFKGSTTTGIGWNGTIRIGGTCKNWRIDHVKFEDTQSSAMRIFGHTYGVIDHCVFDLNGKQGIIVWHDGWNGASNGDGSWSDSLYLGSEKAIYVEDNTFNNIATSGAMQVVDSMAGGRWVFRHNTVNNLTIGNHGTESSGRVRSCFSYEIYNNTFNWTMSGSMFTVFFNRGGTGLMFNNIITGNYNSLCVLRTYRAFHSFSVGGWGACDGTSPYDINDGITYEADTHTGGNGERILESAGKAWTPDQWIGYSLHNTDKNKSSVIVSNTSDTITTAGDPYEESLIFDNGDNFTILKAYPCIDQVGRSTGDLLSGTIPSPQQWPNQVLKPFYEWNNTINGTYVHIAGGAPQLMEGRDYYNDVPQGPVSLRPASCTPLDAYWATDENRLYQCETENTWTEYYTPYPYPHPLTLSGGGLAEDVNGDAAVNILDIQACVNQILMVQDWGSAADVNNSGSVDAVDIQAIVNEVLRI